MAVMTDPRPAPPPVEHPALPLPRYRRFLGGARESWVHWLVLGFLALLVLAPVVPTLIQAFRDRPLFEDGGVFTVQNFGRLFTDAGFGQVIVNTALFAFGTTVLTLLIAVPMAVVVVRTRIPGGRLFAAGMQWPFFISSLILGFGWITMYGPAGFVSTWVRQLMTGTVPWNLYSIPGMAITEAVALAPSPTSSARTPCASPTPRWSPQRRSAGPARSRILRSVIVPMLRPPIVYDSILVFSMSVETLSVPLLYGQPVGIDVFSTFLYNELPVDPPGLRHSRRRVGADPVRHREPGVRAGEAAEERATRRSSPCAARPSARGCWTWAG